jgi:hypothetical protein
MKLKGQHFETVSDIQKESQAVLDSSKENYFHSAFEAWKKQWDFCIRSQGDYFEGDGTKISKLSHHLFFDLVRELSDGTLQFCIFIELCKFTILHNLLLHYSL